MSFKNKWAEAKWEILWQYEFTELSIYCVANCLFDRQLELYADIAYTYKFSSDDEEDIMATEDN